MTASLVSQEVLLISAFFPLQVACHGDALRVTFEPSSRRSHRLTAYILLHEEHPNLPPTPPHRSAYQSVLFIPGFLGSPSGKETTCQCGRCGFDPWMGKIPWRRAWKPTPVFLPGGSHGQRWGTVHRVTKLNTTEVTKQV